MYTFGKEMMEMDVSRVWWSVVMGMTLLGMSSPLLAVYDVGYNCGGDEYVSVEGMIYQADQKYIETRGSGYMDGRPAEPLKEFPVGGAEDPLLYLSERRAFSEYRFDLENGWYVVELHFIDYIAHGDDQRVFTIWLENHVRLPSIDVYDVVGRCYALQYRLAVEVKDKQLNVLATPNIGTGIPSMAAIRVRSTVPHYRQPVPPQNLFVSSSYGRVLLRWVASRDEDLERYEIYRSESSDSKYTLIGTRAPNLNWYHDDVAEQGTTYYYKVIAVDVWDNKSEPTAIDSGCSLDPADSQLPVYQICLSDEALDSLEAHPLTDEYVNGTFIYQGEVYPDVSIRYRGGISRLYPKKSWKVKFNDEKLFYGKKKLNLNADFVDRSLMRSCLSYDVFGQTTCMTPQSQHVCLQLNGRFIGMFVQVEQVDEIFLSDRGRDPNGNLYKCYGNLSIPPDSIPYDSLYEKKTNEGEGYEDLIALIHLLNETPDSLFLHAIASVMDIERFIDYYCGIILTGELDFVRRNYYLYHDLNTDKWEVIPWDKDHTFGNPTRFDTTLFWDGPIDLGTDRNPSPVGGSNVLVDRILDVPEFRRQYCLRLMELLQATFTEPLLVPLVDQYYDEIETDGELDVWKWGWEDNDWFRQGPSRLKTFIRERNDFLWKAVYEYIPTLYHQLRINEFMADNVATLADEYGEYDDWIELYNMGPSDIRLGNMYMTDDLNEPFQWDIPDTVISAWDFLLIWADGTPEQGTLHANFKLSKSGEEVGLYLRQPDIGLSSKDTVFIRSESPDLLLVGVIDTLTFEEQFTDVSYGRYPDGSGGWYFMDTPTPGSANTIPTNQPPEISETTHTPRYPDPGEEVNVTSRIMDDSAIIEALVKYNIGSGFEDLVMYDDGSHGDGDPGDDVYGTYIPPQADGVKVDYYVWAVDDSGAVSTDPFGAPSETYSYVVGYMPPKLFINEFLASNETTNQDEAGDYDDWLEIYNGDTVSINLGGMYLTDELDFPVQWQLPDTVMEPGGFLLVWCDDEPWEGPLHTNFKIDKDGEQLGLYDTDETGNLPIDTLTFGLQTPDVSFGRCPDGGEEWLFFTIPTPEASNEPCGEVWKRGESDPMRLPMGSRRYRIREH
jgi:spore coat protein CotH